MGLNSYTFRHLRICRADLFEEYRRNTNWLLRNGNHAFTDYIRGRDRDFVPEAFCHRYYLYHSWLRAPFPFLEVSSGDADLIKGLIANDESPRDWATQSEVIQRIMDIGWCEDVTLDLDYLVYGEWTSEPPFLAIQNRREQRNFLQYVEAREPEVVVEIGTARGGMLYCFAQLASANATLVSIDLPGGLNCGGQTRAERELFSSFCKCQQRINFLAMDSRLPATRQLLEGILNGKPIDLLFIDGDHSYDGVTADFETYEPLVRAGGAIVFHDIVADPEQWKGTDVRRVWTKLKATAPKYFEFIDYSGAVDRTSNSSQSSEHAWGIGVYEKRA